MSSNHVLAGVIFVAILIAFTAQTELAEYIQATKGYQQPYFLLYTVHSGYILVLPLHMLIFKLLRIDGHAVLQKTRVALQDQLEPRQDPLASQEHAMADRLSYTLGFPAWPFVKMSCALAVFIATPALCWYVSVPFTSMVDITAIYNSNAFWAYLFAIWITKTDKLELKKACAVFLAIIGVVIISYGGAEASRSQADEKGVGSKLIGDLLAFVGSITFAAYELFYEKVAALPSASLHPSEENAVDSAITEPDASKDHHHHQHAREGSRHFLLSRAKRNSYAGVRTDDTPEGGGGGDDADVDLEAGPERSAVAVHDEEDEDDLTPVDRFESQPIYIDASTGQLDSQVFLLHANIITGGIGLATLILLAIPLPFLHWLGWETFRAPPDLSTLIAMVANTIAGVVFNAGFMQLISMAGPVMASVGSLCTLVSVAIADVLLGGRPMEFSSLVGSALITTAFAMLAWNVVRKQPS